LLCRDPDCLHWFQTDGRWDHPLAGHMTGAWHQEDLRRLGLRDKFHSNKPKAWNPSVFGKGGTAGRTPSSTTRDHELHVVLWICRVADSCQCFSSVHALCAQICKGGNAPLQDNSHPVTIHIHQSGRHNILHSCEGSFS